MTLFELVKQNICVPDAAEHYGLQVNRNGMCSCPFHEDRHPSMKTCFVLAAAVRIIQGSATVACLTAVGLVMPVIEQLNYSGAQMAALSICIAGGSIVVSHVNDAGFWLFGKFTGASEAQALKTWTMMETILGTTGAIVGMIAFQLLS